MPLKKSAGNMYEFIDHCWNPVKGNCPFNCSYCYVKRWGEPKPLHLDKKELKTDLGNGNFIFVCSGCDLFHNDVEEQWICDVMNHINDYPNNQYLFHTKDPRRALPWVDATPKNSVLCVTVESNRKYPEISLAPDPWDRLGLLECWDKRRMITVEPILDFDVDVFPELIKRCEPYQVNIGADTGHNDLPEPSPEKIHELIERLRPHTKVHLKKNLSRLYKA
jgi:DNA repair photolyase